MVAYPVPLQNKSELRPYSRQTPFATATENEPKENGRSRTRHPQVQQSRGPRDGSEGCIGAAAPLAAPRRLEVLRLSKASPNKEAA